MTTSPAELVRQYLINQNAVVLGGQPGNWPAYYANKPETPDNLVAIYNTTPMLEGRVHNTGDVDEHAGIQVLIRGTDDRVAWDRGFSIQKALQDMSRYQLFVQDTPPMNFLLWSFRRSQSLTFVGEEEKNRRRLYTINGFLTISSTEATGPVPASATVVDNGTFSVTFDQPIQTFSDITGWSVDNPDLATVIDAVVSVSGNTVIFTALSGGFSHGDGPITVSYDGTGQVKSTQNNLPAPAFIDFGVSNPL